VLEIDLRFRRQSKSTTLAMPFRTDGSSHADGVANEHNVIDSMNANPANLINFALAHVHGSPVQSWSHQGGTGSKADAFVNFENGQEKDVSIKNHGGSGTFDWLNTTHLPDALSQIRPRIDALRTDFLKMKEEMEDAVDDPEDDATDGIDEFVTGIARTELENLLNTHIQQLTSADIGSLLSDLYAKYPEYILIHDKKNSKYILMHKSKTNMADYFNGELVFKLKATDAAKTSRQIFVVAADGTEKNTHLRIRFVLNNGVTALLGFSSANKSSVPVLKIQQDNVADFISSARDKTEYVY
jgi:hypothetical protein